MGVSPFSSAFANVSSRFLNSICLSQLDRGAQVSDRQSFLYCFGLRCLAQIRLECLCTRLFADHAGLLNNYCLSSELGDKFYQLRHV